MSPIEWDITLETGDELVDRQHQTIHRLFNELEASADNEASIMQCLDYLTEHVLMHFDTEEALMASSEFPTERADAHVAEHRLLTEGVRQKVLEFRDGRLTSTAPVIAFLREWLKTHIHECDRELIDHVRVRGGKAVLPEPWTGAEAAAG